MRALGKMQLSTPSIAAKSVLTCTDTYGTEVADAKLAELMVQVERSTIMWL